MVLSTVDLATVVDMSSPTAPLMGGLANDSTPHPLTNQKLVEPTNNESRGVFLQ